MKYKEITPRTVKYADIPADIAASREVKYADITAARALRSAQDTLRAALDEYYYNPRTLSGYPAASAACELLDSTVTDSRQVLALQSDIICVLPPTNFKTFLAMLLAGLSNLIETATRTLADAYAADPSLKP